MANAMSLHRWSKARGLAWSSVQQAQATGRLTPGAGARRWDAEWAAAHDGWPPGAGNGHADGGGGAAGRPGSGTKGAVRSVSEARYWAARAAKEELLLRKLQGEMVEAIDLKRAAFTAGREMLAAMQVAGDRVALELVGATDVAAIRRGLRTAYASAFEGLCGQQKDGDGQVHDESGSGREVRLRRDETKT